MIKKHLETGAALPSAANASELSLQSACRESSYRNTGHIKISFKNRLNSIWGELKGEHPSQLRTTSLIFLNLSFSHPLSTVGKWYKSSLP